MIDCAQYLMALERHGFSFFCGVPDSLLKDICGYIADHCPAERHIITANEGAAIALAAGYHLATERTAVVYMQNSGLGNAVNPLLSLVDPEVYSIPLLLLIGWRGEPGKKDEPQHKKQGRVTLEMLKAMEIPYIIHPKSISEAEQSLAEAKGCMVKRSGPFAFVVETETFERYSFGKGALESSLPTREQAIVTILDSIENAGIIVSTTGMTSREVFEHRAVTGTGHHRDFLAVGSMGHASQIALAIAQSKPQRIVYCLDGDGAVLMHMGSLAIIGSQKPRNLIHIVLNNGAHDSVGGQPTAGFVIELTRIAQACGYRCVMSVSNVDELRKALEQTKGSAGPLLLEMKVKRGARPDLGRPTQSPIENKQALISTLRTT